MKNGLIGKAVATVKDIPVYWTKAPEGKHICYREFAAYSFGGIGVNTINSLFAYVSFSANCLLLFNIMRAAFTGLMFFTSDSPVIFLGSFYFATLAVGGDAVISASMTADIFDYQQWKTGQRLEGFITQFGGMMVSGVGLATGLILPYFYRYYGLHNDYTVLFDEAVRGPIFNVMIIVTIISCVLAVVPILFYDLSAKQLEAIANELEERKAESERGERIV